MKKNIVRLLAICLALVMLLSSAMAEPTTDVSYTITEKLLKQMEAGSGFSARLTAQADAVAGLEAEAVTTLKPLEFDVSLIRVREDAAKGTAADSRLILALMDGDTPLGNAEFSLQGGVAYLRSTLLGEGWYALNGSDLAADAAGDQSGVAQAAQGWLAGTATPGLSAFLAGVALHLHGLDMAALDTAAEPYMTKIDLWIEGFRENAEIGKLEDGTSTIQVDYNIPESAIKAQLKQLVLDMLNDQTLLASLKSFLPAEDVATYLDAGMQAYYFYAIDQLPLNGEIQISRTLSLLGDTLALSLAMPMYDSQGGAVSLVYDRHKGNGDVPDENTIELRGERVLLKADYQTYDTLTGTTVYQGTLLRQPIGIETFAVDAQSGSDMMAGKTLSTAFSLTHAHTAALDADGKDSETTEMSLSLTPDYTPDVRDDRYATPNDAQAAQYVVFTPLDVKLTLKLASGQAKNASTSVDATVEVSGEQLPQTLRLSLTGKTRGLWTPDAIDPAKATSLSTMGSEALQAMIAQAGIRGGLLLLPYISMPAAAGATAPAETIAP
ncbi:MAG: hypothetical protein VB087_11350 [Candidatus Limiplasma sp.]|nr:hypothetical protein [Candidatus Limiplasma sp.]MEA5146703.1 hypothetical protein [Candidatus Limiplasma sp.]